jgi:hypothetical protein
MARSRSSAGLACILPLKERWAVRELKKIARGMVQFLSGLGLIAFGVGLTIVVMWIGMQLGAFAIVFLWE